jgi:hypothetical protein
MYATILPKRAYPKTLAFSQISSFLGSPICSFKTVQMEIATSITGIS